MKRFILFAGLLLLFSAACSSPAAVGSEPQANNAEETRAESEPQSSEEHNEEDDHAGESEEDHGDEHGDEHDDEHDSEEGVREHDAHEHGAAELSVAWSGSELAVDLDTPAYNILGFEYAPSSSEEQAILDETIAALEAGDLLQFSPEADCTVMSASVETELDEAEHSEDEEAEVHSDIVVSYNVQCQNPDRLEMLDLTRLFERFPNFEDLRAQWISDTSQSAKQLTAADPVIAFE